MTHVANIFVVLTVRSGLELGSGLRFDVGLTLGLALSWDLRYGTLGSDGVIRTE